MKIKAAVLYSVNQPFKIENVDLQDPEENEVLIKIKAVGVCRSDWHLVTGATKHPFPLVAGHEGAGKVEKIGKNVTNVKPGDSVVLSWAPFCGECYYCKINRTSLCSTYSETLSNGTMLDGTTRLSLNGRPVYHYCGLACFAEYTTVPSQCCVRVSNEIDFDAASLIGCAVTTGIGSVINTAKVEKGSSVAVFGCGGVGLSTIMGAMLSGAEKIIAVDVSEHKSHLAIKCGATNFIRSDQNVINEIRKLTENRGADYIFETTGIPKIQETCLAAVRPAGTLVLAGLSPMDSTTSFPASSITRNEKIIMGTFYGTSRPDRDFGFIAEQHLKNTIDLSGLISNTYALEEINAAFEEMLSGNSARGVIIL